MVHTQTDWSGLELQAGERMMTDEILTAPALDLTPPTKVEKPKKVKTTVRNEDGSPVVVKEPKEPKAPKAPKENSNRANLGKLYPEDAKLEVLVTSNPKKAGSAAAAIFEYYKDAKTVGDFFAATAKFEFKDKARPGTYADITYDVGHGFIKVG